MSITCDTCGQSYSSGVQPDLFTGKKECLACIENTWIATMFEVLPTGDYEAGAEDEDAWDQLTEKEQELLSSFRSQWKKKGILSTKQVKVLEQIYRKDH